MAFDGASLYRVRASLGFRVMLYTLPMSVDMTSPDYASVEQYQVKDPLTLQPESFVRVCRYRSSGCEAARHR